MAFFHLLFNRYHNIINVNPFDHDSRNDPSQDRLHYDLVLASLLICTYFCLCAVLTRKCSLWQMNKGLSHFYRQLPNLHSFLPLKCFSFNIVQDPDLSQFLIEV